MRETKIGKCPTCGWETRPLSDEEAEDVTAGRLRCSGECQAHAAANVPSSFPPKLELATGIPLNPGKRELSRETAADKQKGEE